MPPLPVDGEDLAAPDGADGFRRQLIADVDELLKEHRLQIAQHVERTIRELRTHLVQPLRSSMRDKIQGQMPRFSEHLHRGSVLSSVRSTRHEAPAAVQEMGRKSAVIQEMGRKSAVVQEMGRKSAVVQEMGRKSAVRLPCEATPETIPTLCGGEQLSDGKLSSSCKGCPSVVPDGGEQLSDGKLSSSCKGCPSAVPQAEEANVVDVRGGVLPADTTHAEVGEDASRQGQTSLVKPIVSWREEMQNRWQSAVAKSAIANSAEDVTRSATPEARGVRGRVRSVVDSSAFEIFTCLAVVSNSVYFGLETQLMAMGIEIGAFEYVGAVFTGVFACELILRFIAAGREFYHTELWVWNVIDTFVVAISLTEVVLAVATPSSGGSGANLTSVRLIRVARIVRIFRVVRVFQVFRSLRILLYCVLHTLRSLLWTIILLMGILYIFGILFTQAASETLSSGSGHLTDLTDQQNYDALKRYYGGLHWAIFTLFKAVTNGLSWEHASAPLAVVHPAWEFLFAVYIAFTYFAVLNVVTGVFCSSAIESASHDKDMVLQAQLSDKKVYTEQLRELFHHIDSSNTGHVDFVMLESCLQDPKCQAYFEVLGITSDDAWNLFMLLDDDDSDQIELEEFVSGCLRLRGASRSIDSQMLLFESRWTMRKIGSLFKAFNELLDHLSSEEAASARQPTITDKRKAADDDPLECYQL